MMRCTWLRSKLLGLRYSTSTQLFSICDSSNMSGEIQSGMCFYGAGKTMRRTLEMASHGMYFQPRS